MISKFIHCFRLNCNNLTYLILANNLFLKKIALNIIILKPNNLNNNCIIITILLP